MPRIVISGAETVSALGRSLAETWKSLSAGESALAVPEMTGPLGNFPVGMVQGLAGNLGSSQRFQALLDRLFEQGPSVPEDSAVIVATTKGAVDELTSEPAGPWPMQPWNLTDRVADGLGLKGPHSTVSAACASGTLALINAAQRLQAGEVRTALVVGIDILSFFVLSGFSKLQALSQKPCRPFDEERDGLSLGEGAGLLLVSTEQECEKQGWPILAEVRGWGAACDAAHITAPSKEATGLLAAINQATCFGKHEVGGINAHGTGTRFNDAMELFAFSSFWRQSPPIHSVKGAIGHCLGAAGVIECALALKSLESGCLPPTAGFRRTGGGDANISGGKTLALRAPSVLSCNSGFGGINAAVLLCASRK